MTKEDAATTMAIKIRKENDAQKRKDDAQYMKIWRFKRDCMHAKGVTARKDEKQQLKDLKNWIRTKDPLNPPPPMLLQPIHDPETKWKAMNPTWLAQEAKKNAKKYGHSQSQSTLVAENEDDDADSEISK